MTTVLSNNNNNVKSDDVSQTLLKGTKSMSISPSRAFFSGESGDEGERRRGLPRAPHRRREFVGLAMISTLVGLAVVAILCLELYRTSEAVALRAELDTLRRDVDKLRHRLLEEDLLSEYKQFEDAVYADVSASEHGHGDADVSSEYSDYDEYSESEAGEPESGSGVADDHHAKYYNMERAKRRRRQVHALPVVAGSYGAPANKTEGLRLYESLVGSTDNNATRYSTEPPLKQYHRISPVRSPKQHRKKYRQQTPVVSTDSASGPLSALITRKSRVMKTDRDPSRRVVAQPQSLPLAQPLSQELKENKFDKTPEGEILFRVYQEQRAVPESTVKSVDIVDVDPNRQRRRKQKPLPHKTLTSVEGIEERPAVNTRHRLLPAAHYNGDTSRYTQAHEHYDGNGRLRHPNGLFTDWSPSKWVQQLGMDRHFKYDGGTVSIKDTGLYLVYAQIHYLDEHDINGYRLYVNDDPMLQCTTMTHSMGRERVKKSNTCFTAAALFLTEDDRISLSDIGGLRYSLFEPAKSFFGLIKLGNVNIK